MSDGSVLASSDEKVLDPFSCLSKKGTKYARETEEVFLSNQGGTRLSENFRHFICLEVVWFNNNRLTRLDNLEHCFRIREIYVQNNRIASLNFLKQFKFLRTLLASNNQIRNLDKQLQLISSLSYLKKLDLFDNSVAEEPDYRLRMIYHAPQVELLDRNGVTMEQRQRAEEVVPNMDKVAAAKPLIAPKKAYTFTGMERDCFRQAKAIRKERERVEVESLRTQVFTKGISEFAPVPKCKTLVELRERWSNPGRLVQHELNAPTPWEKQWHHDNHQSMQVQIEQLAGKDELNRDDVVELAQKLHEEGLEDAGRMLTRPDPFAPLPLTPRESLTNFKTLRKDSAMSRSASKIERSPSKIEMSLSRAASKMSPSRSASKIFQEKRKPHPLDELIDDPESTMPTKKVAAYLLSLGWNRLSDDTLDDRIAEQYEHARIAMCRATVGVKEIKHGNDGDDQVFAKCRDKVTRLEGLKTRKSEVLLHPKPEAGVLRKSRSDVFSQSFLKPIRCIDENTGRTVIQIAQGSKSTTIVDHGRHSR